MNTAMNAARDWPSFPPGYEARLCLDDPFDTAIAAAQSGAEDGLLLWQDRDDRLNAALVLRPFDPLPAALTLSYVGLLGLLDGFAALAPPETPASLTWPDRLLVNDATVGGIRIAHGPLVEKHGMQNVPDWLVLGLAVQMHGDKDDQAPGRELEYTTLFEEGCGEVTPRLLIESFSRHFLGWLDRWQEQGFEPVRRTAELHQTEQRTRLEPNGDASLNDERRELVAALASPSWALPNPGPA
jgi:BirA family biotin operon repressor/biotin-[acetyl-CoA-carboxylase] ligase